MKIGNQHAAFLWRMARMLSNPLQVFVMLRCLRQKKVARKEVTFRIRRLDGKPLICRTGTTDAAVLYDTFCGLYHLPRHHLRSDATIVDLGTNVGYVAAHLAELYPRARIFGLELDAENADMARRNLAQYGDRCSVLTAAIWTHDGTVPYGGEDEWGFKVIERDSEESTQGPQRTAQAISMNTLIRQHKIGKIDFLKMDIEGGEFALLGNSPDWLKNVRAINVEIHDPDRVEEIAEPLISSGFLVQRDHIHWCQLICIRL